MLVVENKGPSIRALEHHSFASVSQTALIHISSCRGGYFESKSESVPMSSYAARHKLDSRDFTLHSYNGHLESDLTHFIRNSLLSNIHSNQNKHSRTFQFVSLHQLYN